MGSEGTTDTSDATWGELLAYLLAFASVGSAAVNYLPVTVALGLSAIAMAVVSVSKDIRRKGSSS
jgi:hypothetical protein